MLYANSLCQCFTPILYANALRPLGCLVIWVQFYKMLPFFFFQSLLIIECKIQIMYLVPILTADLVWVWVSTNLVVFWIFLYANAWRRGGGLRLTSLISKIYWMSLGVSCYVSIQLWKRLQFFLLPIFTYNWMMFLVPILFLFLFSPVLIVSSQWYHQTVFL